MTENSDPEKQESTSQQPSDAWREVGREFEQLGGTIAQAFRTAWNDEENRRKVRELQVGLESMIKDVGQAIEDTTATPEGQRVRDHAVRAADTLVNAGEQTVQEIRPHLISALRQLNDELQKLTSRMEKSTPETPQDPDQPA